MSKYPLHLLILSLLIFVLGMRVWFVMSDERLTPGPASFRTTLLSDPVFQSRFQRVTARVNNTNVTITFDRYPELSYGDTVDVTGTINRKVLDNGQVVFSMFYPKVTLVKTKNIIVLASRSVRERIIELYNRSLPNDQARLLAGIVLGIKGNISKEEALNLQYVGLTHIVAASGMNVTMVAAVLLSIFGIVFKRKTAIVLSLLGIGFYAVIAGLQASIVRASLMAGIAGIGSLLGKQNIAGISLLLTAYIMILFDPYVVFDVGFQLSFLATAGILFIKPRLDTRFKQRKLISTFSGDLTTTLSAQIATIPILILVFGKYGLLSLPVNLLVLWTIPFLMIIGGLGALVGLITPFLGTLVLYLSLPFLYYINLIVDTFGRFHLSFTLEHLPVIFVFSYYFFLLAILFSNNKKKTTS